MDSNGVRNVDEFLRAVHRRRDERTEIHLYRGQPQQWGLLPRLFRWITPEEVRPVEDDLLRLFKNDSPYLLPSKPNNDWDWLSLGQHFGLPTRLLDWTANPLTALFFALDASTPESPVVYVYHGHKSQIVMADHKLKETPFNIERTKLLQPSWHSPRVAAQAGWHTVHRTYRKNGVERFLPLGGMKLHKERLDKIVIDVNYFVDLRRELAEMGIRHATVYGELGAVCRALGWSYGFE